HRDGDLHLGASPAVGVVRVLEPVPGPVLVPAGPVDTSAVEPDLRTRPEHRAGADRHRDRRGAAVTGEGDRRRRAGSVRLDVVPQVRGVCLAERCDGATDRVHLHGGVVGVGDWVGVVDRVAGGGGGVQQVFGDRGVVGVDELVAGFEVGGAVTGEEGHVVLGDAQVGVVELDRGEQVDVAGVGDREAVGHRGAGLAGDQLVGSFDAGAG